MSSPAPLNAEILRQFFPIGDKYPPALTVGLTIFLPFIYILNGLIGVNEFIVLSPQSLLNFNMNQISLYPLGHLGIFHLVFNVLALITPLSQFERRHGTVYTGVILNLFAVSTGLFYAILGLAFYPHGKVLGASAWVFSFAAFFAYKESLIKPTYQITPTLAIPTVYTPFIPLILIAFIAPGSSFLGHFFGLLSGYLYSLGYFNKLVPSSKIIEWIEGKLSKLIELIPTPFKYYREVDAKYLREQEDYSSIFHQSAPVLATSNAASNTNAAAPASFQGQGQVLGV